MVPLSPKLETQSWDSTLTSPSSTMTVREGENWSGWMEAWNVVLPSVFSSLPEEHVKNDVFDSLPLKTRGSFISLPIFWKLVSGMIPPEAVMLTFSGCLSDNLRWRFPFSTWIRDSWVMRLTSTSASPWENGKKSLGVSNKNVFLQLGKSTEGQVSKQENLLSKIEVQKCKFIPVTVAKNPSLAR